MMATMIDTHRLVKRLASKGHFNEEEAAELADALNEALADGVATRSDLDILEARIKTAIVISRNTQIVWTVGAVFALGILQHFFR